MSISDTRNPQGKPTLTDTLTEKLSEIATRVDLKTESNTSIELNLDEALRLSPTHILYLVDNILAGSQVNDRNSFVDIYIDLLRDKNDKVMNRVHGSQSLGSINIFNKNEYEDEYTGLYLDMLIFDDKIYARAKWKQVANDLAPKVKIIDANAFELGLPEFNQSLYVSFPLNKPVRIPPKKDPLLEILRITTFTNGQTIFRVNLHPLSNNYLIYVAKMGCDPTNQSIEVKIDPVDDTYQSIRAPTNCDPHHYSLDILSKFEEKKNARKLNASLLMLNSRQY